MAGGLFLFYIFHRAWDDKNDRVASVPPKTCQGPKDIQSHVSCTLHGDKSESLAAALGGWKRWSLEVNILPGALKSPTCVPSTMKLAHF
jgi:hypothetical protein